MRNPLMAFRDSSLGVRLAIGLAVSLIVMVTLMSLVPLQYAAPVSAVIAVALGIFARRGGSA